MSKYWFKPKRYGIGFGMPITWQGWVALIGFLSLITVSFVVNIITEYNEISQVPKDWLRYVLDVIILTTLFHLLFKDKVEAGLKWRWGGKG